jgi:hypothetical protein
MTPKRILALFAMIALTVAIPIFAQSDRATIVGTVKEPLKIAPFHSLRG